MAEAAWYNVLWLAWALLCEALRNNPRGDATTGLVYHALRIYAFAFHRLRVAGMEHVPLDRRPGPLVVVCNHTAGIDPILVSAAVPFEIRWMMGRDMMRTDLRDIWEWLRIIPVNRKGRDFAGVREAIRHLSEGGVIGVFPEGGLERPPRRLRPFRHGVGFLISRSRARVLPVWITGTPQIDPAWASLRKPSRSRITFGPVMDFAGRSPEEITAEIEAWFARTSGWPRRTESERPSALPILKGGDRGVG
ncbi:MAG TPA: lysophospholipid acyltransferase family protein [Dehalococcoidia bacterium]|nr:lysophospholipid acyltransferase family protein [Dehalococcoidia bacterium]